jgi:nucleotide-binding universal stress UspA family protein
MFNKILVATDASTASNRALKMAANLSAQHDAELLIVHVIRDMQLPPEIREVPELESFNHTREDILRRIAESTLKGAKVIAEKGGAKKIHSVIGSGDPASSIIGFAKRRNIDLIVIGTRGLGKIKGTLLGSVSRKVTNNAETNCLVVR